MSEKEFASALANRINLQLDIPFLSEDQELRYILWMVEKLAPHIPASTREFVLDASDGLSDAEIARAEDFLVGFLNSTIDIPLLPESAEAALIRPVVGAVLDLAREGLSLDTPAAA